MSKPKNEQFSFADQATREIKQSQQTSSAQKTLDWLLQWPRDTVRLNQLLVYGPRPRKRAIAINSAAILVAQGWLIPRPTRRPDMIEWQIVRRPIVHPTIAT